MAACRLAAAALWAAGRPLGGGDLRASRRSRASARASATWDLVLRKLAHVTEYAILGALLAAGARCRRSALALGIAYAASDEVHQHFVAGRHGAPLDVAIDAVGVAVGLFTLRRRLGR